MIWSDRYNGDLERHVRVPGRRHRDDRGPARGPDQCRGAATPSRRAAAGLACLRADPARRRTSACGSGKRPISTPDDCSSKRPKSTPTTDAATPACRAPSILPGVTAGRSSPKPRSTRRFSWPSTRSDRTVWMPAAFPNSGPLICTRSVTTNSLAAYERAIELNPNDADILAEMANSVSCSGEPRRAIDLLGRAMRLNPYYPDWYLWYLRGGAFRSRRLSRRQCIP